MSDWRERAACKGMDVDFFFPGSYDKNHAERAAVCASCPVLAECREYALGTLVQGYWAGMGERERKRQRRLLGIKGAPLLPPDIFGRDGEPKDNIRHGTNAGYGSHIRRSDRPVTCEACLMAHADYVSAQKRWARRKRRQSMTVPVRYPQGKLA